MNGTICLAGVAFAAWGIATSAHAAGDVISFRGAILEPTCALQPGSADGTALVAQCRGTHGVTTTRFQLPEPMETVQLGSRQAQLTLTPVRKDGAEVPGAYVAQVQYL